MWQEVKGVDMHVIASRLTREARAVFMGYVIMQVHVIIYCKYYSYQFKSH